MEPPPDTPSVSTGAVATILLAAAVLSVPLSVILLRVYRAGVFKAMRQVSDAAIGVDDVQGYSLDALPVSASPGPPVELEIVTPEDEADLSAKQAEILRRTQRGLWINSLVYGLAGLVFAIAVSGIYQLNLDTPSSVLRWLILIWVFGWPVVLTIDIVQQGGLALSLRLAAVYFVVLLGLSLTQRESWYSIFILWAVTVLPPSVYQVLFLHRTLRPVGPLVVVFLILSITGAELLLALTATRLGLQVASQVLVMLHLDATAGFFAIGTLGLVLFALPGWFGVKWVARRYDARQVSDQSLAVDALWLVFAISSGLDLANDSAGSALLGVGCFVLFKVVSTIGFTVAARWHGSAPPQRLLFLRVFGSQARSEHLMERLGSRWRYTGVMELIAGTDLATRALEPHDLLDLLRGRLRQRYIASPDALEQRRATVDMRPDPDGRFRLVEFFCFDNTWRFTLSALATRADAVLMDLRGFSPDNQGCIFELQELANRVPLERVVLLVDRTTDVPFLQDVLRSAGEHMASNSPNRLATRLQVLTCDLTHEGAESIRLVLRSLTRAVVARRPALS